MYLYFVLITKRRDRLRQKNERILLQIKKYQNVMYGIKYEANNQKNVKISIKNQQYQFACTKYVTSKKCNSRIYVSVILGDIDTDMGHKYKGSSIL
jgi:Gpi18-like mannosyltransferase